MKLSARVLPIGRVDADLRARMWAIFERYYEGADPDRFVADLLAKDHVFLLFDGTELRGFSTVVVDRVVIEGRTVISVFSGDTVIEAAYHGQNALQWAFFKYIARVKLANPHRTVVWFLISKGYKTYLLLAKNFATFFPRRNRGTPPWARELIDQLAAAKFGETYRRETQTLHFETDHEHLRPDVAPVDGQPDPDVAFFVQRNPGHAHGDELCCIGVVDAALVFGYPLKLLREVRG